MVIAVDDSEIPIGGRAHTILAAILVQEPKVVESALERLKRQFALGPMEEIKWNGCKVEPQHRDTLSSELLVLLRQATALVVISEGANRQLAAEHLAIQIADYLESETWTRSTIVDVVFDESIIGNPSAYSQFLKHSGRPVLQQLTFRSVQSQDSGLVQLADILAGFNRLTTDISLGRSNKQIRIFDDGLGKNVTLDLLDYICLSLRWNAWGKIPPPPNSNDPRFEATWPFKQVGGLGLRLHSSVASDDARDAIYSARIVYMGCLH